MANLLIFHGAVILFIGLLCGAPLGSAAVWALAASSYGFAVVPPLAAHYGHRGLSFAPPLLNRAIYCGNMAGAGGLIIGTAVLLWGAYGAL